MFFLILIEHVGITRRAIGLDLDFIIAGCEQQQDLAISVDKKADRLPNLATPQQVKMRPRICICIDYTIVSLWT